MSDPRKCWYTAIVLAIMSMSTTFAVAGNTSRCFKRDFPPEHSGVRTLYAVNNPSAPLFTLIVNGLPNAAFTTVASYCGPVEGGLTECSIECDGGHVVFGEIQSGQLFARFENLTFELHYQHASILDNNGDADGSSFSGSYLLELSADPSECKSAAESVSAAMDRRVLKPGDMSPDLDMVKSALTKLGYPIANTGWVFTTKLAAQIAEFQRSEGLSATGDIDRPTLDLLEGLAAGSGGGC